LTDKTTTSRAEALALAKQQHMAVWEFLKQEPTRSDLLANLIEEKGEGKELKLLEVLLGTEGPTSACDICEACGMSAGTLSGVAKEANEYLMGKFSNTIEPLKAKRVKICIWCQKGRGGLFVGYYFVCLNTKTKKYLDGDATRNLFKGLRDDFIKNRLCTKLQKEAEERLSEKLEGRDDYQVLDMEIGVVPQKTKENEISEVMDLTRSKTYGHNRVWESFNIDSLFKSSDTSSYIISVDAGGGKTTFLRYLQLELLRKSDIIPIFLDASKMEEWKLENSHQLAEKLAEKFGLESHEDKVVDFFIKAFKKNIILFVDGLDQIKGGGREYEHLANHIFDHLAKSNVIIASRPSAVINLEDEEKFIFLRLKLFNANAQEKYFGEHYKRAQELSVNASDLVAIPMLAYMMRLLIEEKEDKNIKTRTQLYEKFIDYILSKYKHGKVRLDPDLRTQTRLSLRRISYDALACKKPYIQKIPLKFCYKKGRLPDEPTGRKGEFLTKSGLVNLIMERSGEGDKDFLFFTHQSFQEYLAAEYISQDGDLIQRVLSEKWNPKWKETIKFLTGIRGREIIETILSEKDNPIHSKLFLAAELVPETDIDTDLKKKISQKIEELLDSQLFNDEAEVYWAYVDEIKAINRLTKRLEDENSVVRQSSIESLVKLKDKLDLKQAYTVCLSMDVEADFFGAANSCQPVAA